MKPEDKFVTVNGLKLHYLDWGNTKEQTMLLLHGFIAHAHSWDGFAAKMQDKYHVIALDQRGHGDSEWSKDGAYASEDFGDDLAIFVDTLGIEKPVVIGHSMGGRNVIIYAGRNPGKVDKLVAVDSRLRSDPINAMAIQLMAQSILSHLKSMDEGIEALIKFSPSIPRELAEDLVLHGVRKLPDGGYLPKFDLTMKDQAVSKLLVSDLWPYLKKITCPTLIMRGVNSPIMPKDLAEQMTEALPNGQLVEIENAGHLVPQENHVAFENAIMRFLEN
ncbi:MAG: alpha/beta hydrolase [Chloroflexi bacterium]|jgi:pimeloyl-ACP methyl ester carboxylesterase|nr:alpha/beta hydrolase [Chloroflexota bacterium]MBT7080542.1 alpha/beta hydrolase [Chloroflexota bacterium]MBT7289646.1 alpha/beta hydrolase [Chloroflexota bacterium]